MIKINLFFKKIEKLIFVILILTISVFVKNRVMADMLESPKVQCFSDADNVKCCMKIGVLVRCKTAIDTDPSKTMKAISFVGAFGKWSDGVCEDTQNLTIPHCGDISQPCNVNQKCRVCTEIGEFPNEFEYNACKHKIRTCVNSL